MPRRATTVVTYAGLAAGGALVGVLGAFYHLATIDVGGLRLPFMLPVLVALVAVLVHGGGRACGGRLGAVLPAAAWLVVTLFAASPRPEGDVLVTGGWLSLAYLLVGTLAASVAVTRSPHRPRG